jgi:putative ABC transport system permease protein
MGLGRTIALRSLRQKPGRTFFSVSGIAVGIATVVGIFTLDHNTLLGRTKGVEPEWEAEIEVSPGRKMENPRQKLEELPGILGITAAFQKTAWMRLPSMEVGRAGIVSMIALEPRSAASLNALQLDEGRPLDPDAPEGTAEVLIGRALAEGHGLQVGDTIELGRPGRGGGGVSRECVDGEWTEKQRPPKRHPTYTSLQVVGVLAYEGLGRKGRGEVCLVPYDVGLRIFEGQHVATRYWLRRDPEVNVERLQAGLGEAWSYDLKKSVIIGQAADERAFRNGVRFAGLLALVLGLFVIFHTLSMSLVERVKEVGMLHALGATRRQIGRIFLLEAAIIAGLGGAAGFGGGLLLARTLLRKGITTLGVGRPVKVFEVPWELCLPLAVLGVLIALLGSVYPLARARHTDAVSALRGEEQAHTAGGVARGFQIFAAVLLALVLPAVYFFVVPVVGETQSELVGVIMLGLGILALFVIVPLLAPGVLAFVCVRIASLLERAWPLAGKLAARTMTDTPARVAGAAAGIALVTGGFVGLRGMTRSLEAEIEVWSQEAFEDKVYALELPEEAEFTAVAEHLKQYPGVIGVEPNEARTYSPFLVVGVKEDELATYGPCAENPLMIRAMREKRGIVLSRRLARHREYEVGDEVYIEAADGTVHTFPVVGISDAYGYFPHPDERLYGVVSDHWMQKMFCMDTGLSTQIAVRFDDDVDPDQMLLTTQTALAELFPATKIRYRPGAELYEWHASDISRDFVLFDIIIGLTVLLAGIGVLNGQLLSALERAKELGVLKALGVTRRQIAGMVMLESGVVGLLGGGLGVALGSLISPFIVEALQVISGLSLPLRGAGVFLAWGWLGAVTVALLAGVYPVWRMNRADAIAAVRTGG